MSGQPSDLQARIGELFARWIPSQRWFAGKGREATVTARLLADRVAHDSPAQIWLADFAYVDGTTETYQVPIVRYGEFVDALGHVFIGALEHDDTPTQFLYDALHDKAVTNSWLISIRDNATVGPVRYVRTTADELDIDAPSLALTGEQSNTSLVFGDTAILKVFRRLEHGENPDIEIHRALLTIDGRHVAQILGYVEVLEHAAGGAAQDAEPISLAMLQRYLPTASDGWELAKISVRDLMAEADLHAAEAGGDFAGEARRLGAATAEVHADLARAFGVVAMDRDTLRQTADTMLRRLDAALPVVAELDSAAPALREAYEAIATLPAHTIAAQRVHGDLHLGQTLRTARGWVMLDFEGEPARGIAERRTPDSPVRDVAGMLRSFDYVASHQLIDSPSAPQSAYRAAEWATRNRDAFCDGYREASGDDIDPVLLRAYEADKAVYEAVYEARNRPNWLGVPLASLARLAPNSHTHRDSRRDPATDQSQEPS